MWIVHKIIHFFLQNINLNYIYILEVFKNNFT